MANLFLNLLTPSKTIYQDYILSISFVDHEGKRMILKDYSSTIGVVQSGTIEIKTLNNEIFEYMIDSGCYIVSNNNMKLLTSFCVENNENEIQKIIENRNSNIQILNDSHHHSFEFTSEIPILKNMLNMKK